MNHSSFPPILEWSFTVTLQEHRRQLGPAQGIREMCRTAVSLPKLAGDGDATLRPKPRPVLRPHSADKIKKDPLWFFLTSASLLVTRALLLVARLG